ncbi:putative vacuolar membrane protein [Smittium mucronatum]|uniref:Putative vacuolar membrane protein n=1 Tax=Smittium mucronatum TaxID=133383 RepID=A0A1R0GNG0_9FUNG|nr:putative vacuolar membrane protein [Smittium mucronatum]
MENRSSQEGLSRLYVSSNPEKFLALGNEIVCDDFSNEQIEPVISDTYLSEESDISESSNDRNISTFEEYNRNSTDSNFIQLSPIGCVNFLDSSLTISEMNNLYFHDYDKWLSLVSQYALKNHLKSVIINYVLVFVFLSFMLNFFSYLWYAALEFTTISKVTAIYNTSCFFAYLFSVLILKHKLKLSKIMSVVLSVIGVFIMSFIDFNANSKNNPSKFTDYTKKHQFLGDILICLCSIGTGLTQTMYGKYIKPRNYYSMLFINFSTFSLGLATLLCNWIVIFFLDFTKIEIFAIPNQFQMKFILINTLFGLVYNASFIILLSLTSPIFAAVGVMLTIPISILADIFIEGNIINPSVYFGGIFVLAGFFLLSYVQYHEDSR